MSYQAPLRDMRFVLHELFDVLHARRRRRGSIDFDLSESEIVLDDQGTVEAIVAAERNVAHRIVEECMLLANETVAAHLERARMPALYRIHETPDPLQDQERSVPLVHVTDVGRHPQRRQGPESSDPENELLL